MPNDGSHFKALIRSVVAVRDQTTSQVAANSDMSMQELLVMNTRLLAQNRQLAVALGRQAPTWPAATPVLTPRQQQVMALVLEGQCSKNIAADLDISQRTVENHRAAVMRRTGATSLPALARLALGLCDQVDRQMQAHDRPDSRALP